VALKETGAHQIAQQLTDPARFARFVKIVREANGGIASTPEAADFFRLFRGNGIEFVPTPYPVEDEHWNWAMENRSGIFVAACAWAGWARWIVSHCPKHVAKKVAMASWWKSRGGC